MSAITWHSQDEKPDSETIAVVATPAGVYLIERLYRWNGESWIGFGGRPLMIEKFWWASEADILSTLKAALEARHV